jgi:hypothetical protein
VLVAVPVLQLQRLVRSIERVQPEFAFLGDGGAESASLPILAVRIGASAVLGPMLATARRSCQAADSTPDSAPLPSLAIQMRLPWGGGPLELGSTVRLLARAAMSLPCGVREVAGSGRFPAGRDGLVG